MASIVSCPGCQKRLKIGTDKPGGKLRCPSCNTPFVLGSRTNEGSGGTAEFLAFELFEDDIVTDAFTIEEERPASKPKQAPKPPPKPAVLLPKSTPPSSPKAPAKPAVPLSSSSQAKAVPRPAPTPASPPTPKSSPAASKLLPDDLDLLGEGAPPRPALPPPPPAPPPQPPKDEPVLPEEFGLAGEKKPDTGFEPWPAAPRPSAVTRPEPILAPPRSEPAPPRAAPANEEAFFLPADFDPFAAPAAKTAGARNLSLDDDFPGLVGDRVPDLVEDNFDVIEGGIRTAADGVAVVEGATAADEAADEAHFADYRQASAVPRDRGQRRAQRRSSARKNRVHTDVRGRWAVVHWGLTVELIALAVFVFCGILGLFAGFLGMVARSVVGPSILIIIMAGLMALREVLVMLGYGLCIPAPAKNNAWLWALLALLFAFLSLGGYVVGILFPLAFLVMPVTLISWFFYLIYLKSVAEALKIPYLAEEAMNVMKLLGIMLMGTFVLWAGMLALVLFIKPNSYADLGMMGLIILTCSGIFGIFALIMTVVIVYKYYYVLMNLRLEIGWRLES